MIVGDNNSRPREESIYNLIPRTAYYAPKPPRYESNFKKNVRESLKDGKYGHRTMGHADEPLPDPQNFLKKRQNDNKKFEIRNQRSASTSRITEQRKPPVPSIRAAPKMGIRTEKNFIQTNALDVVMQVPKQPQRNMVDDRFGDKFPIGPSGLAPKYVYKKNFGEIPNYIKTRKQDIHRAKQEYENYVSEYYRRGAMHEMDENERQNIIEGLKQQWEDVHHEYQTLSVIIDTIPKRLHKERLEHQMQLLEKDIDLLQKHQIIYIAD